PNEDTVVQASTVAGPSPFTEASGFAPGSAAASKDCGVGAAEDVFMKINIPATPSDKSPKAIFLIIRGYFPLNSDFMEFAPLVSTKKAVIFGIFWWEVWGRPNWEGRPLRARFLPGRAYRPEGRHLRARGLVACLEKTQSTTTR